MLRREPPTWLRRQLRLVVLLDATAAAGATLFARFWAFGPEDLATVELRSVEIPYSAAVVVATPLWLGVLAVSRCYDLGPFGLVEHESRRIVRAGAQFLALTAIIYYIVNVERVARGFLVAIIPLAVVLTLVGRWLARRHLRLQRRHGRAGRRALFVGPTRATDVLLRHLADHSQSELVQASLLSGNGEAPREGSPSGQHPADPRADTTADALRLLPATDADLVVVTGALAAGELRQLTWQLEGTGVEVLVAPAAGQLSGPQLDVRPVAGLPLLYVDR